MARLIFLLVVGLLGLVATAGAAERDVLFLADSHGLGPFGEAFEARLSEEPGIEVDTYALGGSAPSWFYYGTVSACGYAGRAAHDIPPHSRKCARMRTPYVETLLKKGQDVVVALGTNMIIDPRGMKFNRSITERMVRSIQAAGARCVWIGPPRMRRFSEAQLEATYQALEKGLVGDPRLEPCRLIDSRKYTSYPAKGGDGIHFSFPAGMPIGHAWGRATATEALELLRR